MEQRPLSTVFYVLVWISLGLTAFSALASIGLLATVSPNDPARAGLIDTFSTTWKIGFGAIIGLIGGKVT